MEKSFFALGCALILRTTMSCLCLLGLAAAPIFSAVGRYGLFIGSNIAVPGNKPLLFAENDAEKVASVFTQLGGIPHENAMVLLSPTADKIKRAIARIAQRINRSGERNAAAFILYYSGHATRTHWILKGQYLPMQDIRQAIQTFPAKIRIGLFDACHSGVLTQTKGAIPLPPINLEDHQHTTGLVLISSSAMNEFAQESDELQSSFFTHHFVSALRGAADGNGDKKVSLMESYAYTYNKTVRHTSQTRVIQHPKASFQMETKGDFILSNLFQQQTGVVLASETSGHYLVISSANSVVAELDKKKGQEIIIALMPGKYKIHKRGNANLYATQLVLKKGNMVIVQPAKMHREPLKRYTAKVSPANNSKWKRWKKKWKPTLNLGFSQPVADYILGMEADAGSDWFVRCNYARRWGSQNPSHVLIKTYLAHNNYPGKEGHWLNFGWGKQFRLTKSLQLAGVMAFHRGWEKAGYYKTTLYKYRTQCTDASGNLLAAANCYDLEFYKSEEAMTTFLNRYAFSIQLGLRFIIWPRTDCFIESGLGYRVRNLNYYVFQTRPPILGIKVRL